MGRRKTLVFSQWKTMGSWSPAGLPPAFPHLKSLLLLLLCSGLAWDSPEWQSLICNSLCIPNKPIFAGEIYGPLFVLGEHFGGLQGGQRRCQSWFWNWWGNRCSRHLEPTVTDYSFPGHEVWRYIFFSESEFTPSLCLKFSGFYSGSILKFCLSC